MHVKRVHRVAGRVADQGEEHEEEHGQELHDGAKVEGNVLGAALAGPAAPLVETPRGMEVGCVAKGAAAEEHVEELLRVDVLGVVAVEPGGRAATSAGAEPFSR